MIHHGDKDREEAGDANTGENLTIGVVGIQGHCSLPEVQQSLRDSDHEQTTGFATVVTCEAA